MKATAVGQGKVDRYAFDGNPFTFLFSFMETTHYPTLSHGSLTCCCFFSLCTEAHAPGGWVIVHSGRTGSGVGDGVWYIVSSKLKMRRRGVQ